MLAFELQRNTLNTVYDAWIIYSVPFKVWGQYVFKYNIHQGCIQLNKSDINEFYDFTTFKFQINSVPLNFQRILKHKMYHGFHKIFNIHNNQKCFLSTESGY